MGLVEYLIFAVAALVIYYFVRATIKLGVYIAGAIAVYVLLRLLGLL